MNNKYKYLFNNSLLFALGNFAPKILSFLLVPLYTSYLTTSEYGIADILLSTAFIVMPIFICEIYESVLRFCLDDKLDKDVILSTVLKFSMRQSAFLLLVSFVLCAVFFCLDKLKICLYIIFILLIVISNAIYYIVLNYLRGTERIKDVVVLSVATTVLNAGLNILLLVVFNTGILGYILSSELSLVLGSILVFLKTKAIKGLNLKKADSTLLKEMLSYSKPLILNKLSWDILSYSDKFTLTIISGSAVNGVYSVSTKIPTILSTLSNVFSDAWRLSAVKEFDKDDKSGFFSTMYNMFTTFLVLCCSVIIMLNIPLSSILYEKEFFIAWKYVPFLLISVVLSSMSSFLASIFMAVKETKVIQNSTIVSSIVNIVLNIILILIIGPIGAAITTTISGYIRWIYRHKMMYKYVNCKFEFVKFNIELGLLLVQTYILSNGLNKMSIFLSIVVFMILIVINFNYVFVIMKKIIRR